MEWVQVVIGILEIVAIIILGLFLKNYFPSYMDEKGKNLATKEDIAEITRKTEVVQQEFRENFERFSSDIRFKYDFYYRQYTELYCKLYAIVIQSEYVRRFMKLQTGKETSFDEAPFLEISPTRRITNALKFENGAASKVSTETEEIITPISQFNKKQLCDYIIENGAYSSQKLLKIAMSYRFAYNYYSGNPETKNSECQKIADDEEFRLIREMICCIVSEYNYYRKALNMNYDENELNTGIPQL